MLREEYGLPYEVRSPKSAAFATFTSFLGCGVVPLLPYLFHLDRAFEVSVFMTGLVFFLIGSFKSRWSTSSWWWSGLSTLLVGGIAAMLAYLVGMFLRSVAGQA